MYMDMMELFKQYGLRRCSVVLDPNEVQNYLKCQGKKQEFRIECKSDVYIKEEILGEESSEESLLENDEKSLLETNEESSSTFFPQFENVFISECDIKYEEIDLEHDEQLDPPAELIYLGDKIDDIIPDIIPDKCTSSLPNKLPSTTTTSESTIVITQKNIPNILRRKRTIVSQHSITTQETSQPSVTSHYSTTSQDSKKVKHSIESKCSVNAQCPIQLQHSIVPHETEHLSVDIETRDEQQQLYVLNAPVASFADNYSLTLPLIAVPGAISNGFNVIQPSFEQQYIIINNEPTTKPIVLNEINGQNTVQTLPRLLSDPSVIVSSESVSNTMKISATQQQTKVRKILPLPRTIIDKPTFSCEICQLRFSSGRAAKAHFYLTHHVEDHCYTNLQDDNTTEENLLKKNSCYCKHCGIRFEKLDGMEQAMHMKTFHSNIAKETEAVSGKEQPLSSKHPHDTNNEISSNQQSATQQDLTITKEIIVISSDNEETPSTVQLPARRKRKPSRRPRICKFCSIHFEDSEEYVSHMKKHQSELLKCTSSTDDVIVDTEKNTIYLYCKFCGKQFNNFAEWTNHTVTDHPVKSNLIEPSTSKDRDEIIGSDLESTPIASFCQFCGINYEDNDVRLSHIEENHKDVIHCDKCNELFIDMFHYTCHFCLNKYKCQDCGMTFSIREDLSSHLFKSHIKVPKVFTQNYWKLRLKFNCDICSRNNKVTTTVLHQSRHDIKCHFDATHHVSSILYECPNCNFLPVRENKFSSLCEHLVYFHMHEDLKSNIINVMQHTDSEAVTEHIINEEVCDQLLTFKCLSCDERFEKVVHLQNHVIQKHPSCSIPCLYCTERFHSRMELRAHFINFHHICIVCNIQFPDLCTVNRHMQDHENGTVFQYVCRMCKFTFQTYSSIETHIEQKHPLYKITFTGILSMRGKVEYETYYPNNELISVNMKQCPFCFRVDDKAIDHIVQHRVCFCPGCQGYYLQYKKENGTFCLCQICGCKWNISKTILNQFNANEPKKLLSYTDLKEFECCHCIQIFSNDEDKYKHQLVCTVNIGEREKQEGTIMCIECDRAFHTVEQCERHREKHNALKFTLPCIFCKGNFLRSEISEHFQREHLYCGGCNETFPSLTSFKLHDKQHAIQKILLEDCLDCNARLTSTKMIEHYKIKHPNRSNFASRCAFLVMPLLNDRELLKHGSVRYQCSYCRVFVTCESKFVTHLNRKHGIVKCLKCNAYSFESECRKCTYIICE